MEGIVLPLHLCANYLSAKMKYLAESNPNCKKSRAWIFTYNNPQTYDYSALPCEYVIVGHEHAPETGTFHHQGYARWKNAVSFKSVKKALPKGCHIESAIASPQANIKYCSKELIGYERGERPKMGKRNDIHKVKDLVSQGKGMNDIIDSVDSYQAIRAGELILKYKEPERNWKPTVLWFYGPTDTGKTRTAMDILDRPWLSSKSLKWWDGYDAHENIIIDDFRKDFCTFHELLRILDRYPYRVEYKGGSRQLLAKNIIITCPYPPDEVYSTREDVNQLIRRIDKIKLINFYSEGLSLQSILQDDTLQQEETGEETTSQA